MGKLFVDSAALLSKSMADTDISYHESKTKTKQVDEKKDDRDSEGGDLCDEHNHYHHHHHYASKAATRVNKPITKKKKKKKKSTVATSIVGKCPVRTIVKHKGHTLMLTNIKNLPRRNLAT